MSATAEEILDKIKEKYSIGAAWQISKPYILDAMEEYANERSDEFKNKSEHLQILVDMYIELFRSARESDPIKKLMDDLKERK